MRIAWLGTGVMGAPMAGRLVAAGREVVAFNRTRVKADAWAENGECALSKNRGTLPPPAASVTTTVPPAVWPIVSVATICPEVPTTSRRRRGSSSGVL